MIEKNKSSLRINLGKISKVFNIGFKKNEGSLARTISYVSGRESKKEINVLKNISFRVSSKEVIGIIGKNGSGKSTLLRVIAGIYTPNSGELETKGSVVYLNGFGQGLKDKLTMRENIYLIGALMGLGKKDINKKFNEIVEFSGLKDYVNTKVYQFSSGMVARLNFSITLHCVKHHNPDILLLDEVFASGGDEEFNQKSLRKMEELILGGATVLIVSHDLNLIKKYCNKVVVLDKGEISYFGDPEKAVSTYLNSLIV